MYKICSEEEKRFLENYDINDYERPSVAVDVVCFATEGSNMKVLLVRRPDFPYKGCWALPGGFVSKDNTMPETALHVLKRETGVSANYLEISGIYSNPERDPRGWIISNTYCVLVNYEECNIEAKEDVGEARWVDLTLKDSQIKLPVDDVDLAFDHEMIIRDAFEKIRKEAKYNPVFAAKCLHEEFTVAELREANEAILGQNIVKNTFHRNVAGYLEDTSKTVATKRRNAKVYRVKNEYL